MTMGIAGRPKGRKFTCRRCGRLVGEHGYSNSGGLAIHKCPHGERCSFDLDSPRYTKCVQCQGRVVTPEEQKQLEIERGKKSAHAV